MRRYHQALLVTFVCTLVLAAGLLRAYLAEPKPLTSAEVLAATRRSVGLAVDTAIARGGLEGAERFVANAIASDLHRQGFGGVSVRLVRPNDVNRFAAFYFSVNASGLVVRFDLDGTRDPLLAIRLGLDVRIRPDSFHPYQNHREPGILAACLDGHLYHLAPEGPDFFARLENRTRDPYHFGFESLLAADDLLAADYAFLESGAWGFDAEHRARYGL